MHSHAKLKKWMAGNDTTQQALADLLGAQLGWTVRQGMVSDWLLGKHKPRAVYRLAIERATGGKVKASKWAT